MAGSEVKFDERGDGMGRYNIYNYRRSYANGASFQSMDTCTPQSNSAQFEPAPAITGPSNIYGGSGAIAGRTQLPVGGPIGGGSNNIASKAIDESQSQSQSNNEPSNVNSQLNSNKDGADQTFLNLLAAQQTSEQLGAPMMIDRSTGEFSGQQQQQQELINYTNANSASLITRSSPSMRAAALDANSVQDNLHLLKPWISQQQQQQSSQQRISHHEPQQLQNHQHHNQQQDSRIRLDQLEEGLPPSDDTSMIPGVHQSHLGGIPIVPVPGYPVQSFAGVGVSYEYSLAGKWSEKEYNLELDELEFGECILGGPPESFCSKPCQMFEIKITAGDICCWMCRACAENEIKANETSCEACKAGWWPEDNKVKCRKLPEEYIKWPSIHAIVPTVVASVGLMLTTFVTYTFFRFRDTPLVKASGIELSFILLAGMGCCHVSTFILLAKPSGLVCGCQRFMVSS